MSKENRFDDLFAAGKPIIGMIHLAGINRREKIKKALEELAIYEQEGVNGAIIEDYHGSAEDVNEALKHSQGKFKLVIGINILRDPYSGFELANKYGARFIQFDSVQTPDLNLKLYEKRRIQFPDIAVFGGIGFKYTAPTGNPLEVDLREAKQRCEAIVTTGRGTGIETPLCKLEQYKELLGSFPLIVGAGVNLKNVYEQLNVADGAIIGSYFKLGRNTSLPVNRVRVRELMGLANKVRGKT